MSDLESNIQEFSETLNATLAFEALRRGKTAQEIAARRITYRPRAATWMRQAIGHDPFAP